MRLHRLERPEQWQPELLEAIWQAQKPINHYPDYDEFHSRLARFAGVSKHELVLGAGIEDFIRNLFLLCGQANVVAYTWPTCAMFDIYAEVFSADPHRIVFTPEEPITVDRVIGGLPPETTLLILPNPGQPVETVFSLGEMTAIATHCHKIGAVLAVDEAYHGFGADTSLPLLDRFENVVILRTFSKAFGAAGIRVGYAIGRHAIIRALDAIRLSGEIAGPSLTAATVLMDHWDSHVKRGVQDICDGRDWLRETLIEAGFETSGYFANHVLVDMGSQERAESVAAKLLAEGVHVRQNKPPVDEHLMVTCGSVPLMQRFFGKFLEAAKP